MKNIFGEWSHRDWAWLLIILIGIIILVSTYRLADNQDVVNLFSFISSSVSIALAIVAIFLALKQDSDSRYSNDVVKDKLGDILKELSKVQIQMTTGSVIEAKEETMVEMKVEDRTYNKEEVEKMIVDAMEIFSDRIEREISEVSISNRNGILMNALSALSDFNGNTKNNLTSQQLVVSAVKDMKNMNLDLNTGNIVDFISKFYNRNLSEALVKKHLKKYLSENNLN